MFTPPNSLPNLRTGGGGRLIIKYVSISREDNKNSLRYPLHNRKNWREFGGRFLIKKAVRPRKSI